MNKNIALLSAVSALVIAGNANALEFKPYVGAQYNYTKVDAEIEPKLNSGSVFIGTEYNKYFGTEVFYQLSDDDEDNNVKSDFTAYGLDAYAYLPLGCDQVWSVFATGGIANYDFDMKSDEGKSEDNGLGYRLGAGVQYNITNNLSVRALGRYIWTDKLDGFDSFTEFSLGAKYTF